MKQREIFLLGLWGIFLLSEIVYANFHEEHELLSESSQGDLYQGNSKFKCPFPFGVFSDPEDCEYYYNCISGVAFHKKCYRFTKFDIWRRRCLPSGIAICGNKDKTKTTPFVSTPTDTITTKDQFVCPNFMGNFPHPNDCSKYYSCMMYMATVKTCPRHELFDAVDKRCKRQREVHCGDRPKPGSTTISISTESTPIEETTTVTEKITETIPTETTTVTEKITETVPTETETTTVTEKITETIPTETTTVTEKITETIPTETTTVTEKITETIPTETETTTVTEKITEAIPTETTTERITQTDKDIHTEDTTTDITTIQPTPPEHDCNEDDEDCIITETGDPKNWFKCPRDVGSFPHPSSDKLFIFCMNWIPSAKKCGLNRVFSKERSTCVNITYLS